MIKLNDDYIIEIDGRNYTLKSKYEKKNIDDDEDTQFDFGTIGYYGNLKNAVKAAAEDKIRRKLSKGVHSLEDAVEIIDKAYREYEKAYNKATKGFGSGISEDIPEIVKPEKKTRKKKE